MKTGFGRMMRAAAALVLCVCLGAVPAALAGEPAIVDSMAIFCANMTMLGHDYSEGHQSYGNNVCMVLKDRSTYAGYGWDAAYTLIFEGTGDEFDGRMTSMTYDAALERTFAPGKTDSVLKDAYEMFIWAAGMQLDETNGDRDRFESLYSPSRMWLVLGRAMNADFDPSQLSARIGGWDIYVDVAYGENEMHFYFYMSR